MLHEELTFEVSPTEQLTILDHELVATLELMTTGYTHEALQMEHVTNCPHNQLIRRDSLHASAASCCVQSANTTSRDA